MKLDDLLSSQDGSPGVPSDRLRATLLAELAVTPMRSWRADVVRLVGACWLLIAAVAGVLIAMGWVTVAFLAERASTIVGLLGLAAAFAFVAIAPRQGRRVSIALGVAAVAMVGLVLARQTGQVSAAPAWVCSVSQLLIAAAPMIFGLSLLRQSAVTPGRAAVLGVAVGTTGAILGELVCEQGFAHVALWHVGAWALLAGAAAVASRRLVPRSFAP